MTARSTRTIVSLALATTLAATWLDCSGDTIAFDATQSIPEQTVPGNALAHDAGITIDGSAVIPLALDGNLQNAARTNGVGDVARVNLAAVTLTIDNGGCWDFIDSVAIEIDSTKAGTTLPTAIVAMGSQPGCITSWSLTPITTVDLKPYFQEGVRVTSRGRGIAPAQDVTFGGRVVLHAQVF